MCVCVCARERERERVCVYKVIWELRGGGKEGGYMLEFDGQSTRPAQLP